MFHSCYQMSLCEPLFDDLHFQRVFSSSLVSLWHYRYCPVVFQRHGRLHQQQQQQQVYFKLNIAYKACARN